MLPGDIIQLGSVGEHGGGVKVGRGGRSPGKNDAPEFFRRMDKKIRKNLSLLGNKMTFLAVEEAAVGRANVGV